LQTRNDLLNEAYLYTETLLQTIRLPFLILDSISRVKSANKAFYSTFNITEAEPKGIRIYDLGNGQWNIPKLRELLETIIPQNTSFDNFEVETEFKGVGKKTMLLNGRRIPLNGQPLIILAIADISETRELASEKDRIERKALQEKVDAEKKISEAFKQADAYIRNVFMQAPVSIVVYKGPSFIIDLINENGLAMWGTTRDKVINKLYLKSVQNCVNRNGKNPH
jgi:two-component system CheB/CheR fusion protein